MMRIGIIVTYHNFVNKFILPCLDSLNRNIDCSKFVCVFDNESKHEDNYKVVDFCRANKDFFYIRIGDQNKNGGLTATWNAGVDLCIQRGCEMIFIINDDILINDTWRFFVQSITDDDVVYGPVTNNPGHAWVDQHERWMLKHLFGHNKKKQYSGNGKGRNEDVTHVGFVNGFCFGCTVRTFTNHMYDEKHYFDPDFPFGGNETEFQLRLFNLEPTKDNTKNKKLLSSLDAHNKAVIVPKCYVYHYKNHAWKINGGGRFSKEQFS